MTVVSVGDVIATCLTLLIGVLFCIIVAKLIKWKPNHEAEKINVLIEQNKEMIQLLKEMKHEARDKLFI